MPLVLQAGLLTLAFVRIGCSVKHEHLGAVAPAWLGFADNIGIHRHDLGLYECIFLWVVIVPFIWKYRDDIYKSAKVTVSLIIAFLVFRFALEFLRNDEVKLTQLVLPTVYIGSAGLVCIFKKYLLNGEHYENQAVL